MSINIVGYQRRQRLGDTRLAQDNTGSLSQASTMLKFETCKCGCIAYEWMA